jgi:hypothetical protein
MNSIGNYAAQDVFTPFNRKERQLETQPYLAGFLLPECSVLAAEYQALGAGQRNCDLSARDRQPQFNLEAKGHRCAAGINRVSIGRKFTQTDCDRGRFATLRGCGPGARVPVSQRRINLQMPRTSFSASTTPASLSMGLDSFQRALSRFS